GRFGRDAVGVAIERHPPRECLCRRVIARSVAQRPVLTPSGYRHEYDVRLYRPTMGVPDAPSVERAGTKVLHDHVGGGHQVKEQLPPGVEVKVDRDGALVTVGRLVDIAKTCPR